MNMFVIQFRVAFNKDHMFAQDSRQLQAFLGDVPLGNTELLAVSGAPEYMKVQTLSFSKAGDFPCNKLDENMRFLMYGRSQYFYCYEIFV